MAPRVLVTREQAEPLAAALAAQGLTAVHLPLVRLVATAAPPPCLAPAQVLLTSAAALRHCTDLAEWVGPARVVVVGAKTATAAEQAGLAIAAMGTMGGTDALALIDAALQPTVFVGAARPAPAMSAALAAGALLHWKVYDRHPVPDGLVPPPVDLVTLTSPSAVRAWSRLVPAHDVPVVVIGQTTAAAASAAGLVVLGVAATPDLAALARAAGQALRIS